MKRACWAAMWSGGRAGKAANGSERTRRGLQGQEGDRLSLGAFISGMQAGEGLEEVGERVIRDLGTLRSWSRPTPWCRAV